MLIGEDVVSEFAGFVEAPVQLYKAEDAHVSWKGWAIPTQAKPGEKITLWFEGTPDVDWHLYPFSAEPVEEGVRPVLLHFAIDNGWGLGQPTPDAQPVEKEVLGELVRVHPGKTSWSMEVTIPDDAEPGSYQLSGSLGYQACTKQQCDMPLAVDFQLAVGVGPGSRRKINVDLIPRGLGVQRRGRGGQGITGCR